MPPEFLVPKPAELRSDLSTKTLDLISSGATEVVGAIVNGMVDAAVLLDAEFKPLAYNYAWALMTGLKRRELEKRIAAGITGFELLDGQTAALKDAANKSLGELREVRLDALPIKNAIGETVNVVASLLPLRDSGLRLVGLLLVLRDITSEVQVQDKYKEMLALEKVRGDQLEREVEARTLDLRAALEQVTRMSRTDPLTGLMNRRAFSDMAEQALNLAARHKRHLAVIICDLDHFKRVNDSFGHQAGDIVLVNSAKALSQAVRKTDVVARFGGEEFVILLTEADQEHVLEVAHRCHERVRQMPVQTLVPGIKKPQTVSVGVAIFPEDGHTLDALIQNADKALYKAKADGRDRVVQYHSSIQNIKPPGQPATLNVLLASDSIGTTQSLKGRLSEAFQVHTASSVGHGLDVALQNMVDVIIVDEALCDGQGLDLIHSSLSVLPNAFRVMMVETEDAFSKTRRETSFIDCFLLKSEAESKLEDAIHDGLALRKVTHFQAANAPLIRVGDETVSRLDKLIESEALNLHFQPLIDLKEQRIAAWEALSRVDEPVLKNPEFLFDAAVASGRIWKLSRLVRKKASKVIDSIPGNEWLFVNLHPAEVEDPQLLEDNHLRACASRIVFEITERAALPDYERFRERMKRLRKAGYRFAIDDLGAGYASLNAVALLEPDFVKLDRLTVQTMAKNQSLRILVRRIVDFANEVSIRVVGEGVETEQEFRALQEVGCHWGQGYYLGRPDKDLRRGSHFFG